MKNDIGKAGSSPAGFTGRIAGRVMNLIHAGQYRKAIAGALAEYPADGAPTVLDIGCGGGMAIKLFCALANKPKVFGVDISPDMVALAKKVNKACVAAGNVDIVQGNASDLPFMDNCFDIVTAFDTINFWNDLKRAMHEITRVLAENGMFMIINGYPAEGTKWWDFVKFKTEDEYVKMLAGYGFKDIKTAVQNRTIIIKAYKRR